MIDSTIFLMISFLLFILIIYKKVYRRILDFIDGYINEIKNQKCDMEVKINILKKQLKKEQHQHLHLKQEINETLKSGQNKIQQIIENLRLEQLEEIQLKKRSADVAILQAQAHVLYLLRCEVNDTLIEKLNFIVRNKIQEDKGENIALLHLQENDSVRNKVHQYYKK